MAVNMARKRTELAFERTVLAYLRTAATLILFGLAFLGFSKDIRSFFYIAWISVSFGVLLLVFTVFRSVKHAREIMF